MRTSAKGDVGLGVFVVACALFGLWVGTWIRENVAQAQSIYTPPPSTPGVINGPTIVNGYVTMTQGMTVDGGVKAQDFASSTAEVGLATVGVLDAGTFNVAGASSFQFRPVGVFLSGTLTRGGGLTVGIGCSTTGGAISVPGAMVGDSCDVASMPASALSTGVTFDCFVTAANTVTVRSCGLVALVAAPAGDYRVVVSGPAP